MAAVGHGDTESRWRVRSAWALLAACAALVMQASALFTKTWVPQGVKSLGEVAAMSEGLQAAGRWVGGGAEQREHWGTQCADATTRWALKSDFHAVLCWHCTSDQ